MDSISRALAALRDFPLQGKVRRTLAQRGSNLAVGGLRGGASYLFAASLVDAESSGPLLFLTPSEPLREELEEALTTLGVPHASFPALYSLHRRDAGSEARSARERIETVSRLRERDPELRVVTASLQSMLQEVPRAEAMTRHSIEFAVGARLDEETLLEQLAELRYARVPQVAAEGEFARRGDILDLFPHGQDEPLRIELFDDEIESLRTFDAASQRSTATLERLRLFLGARPGDEGAFLLEEREALAGLVVLEAERFEEAREAVQGDARLGAGLTVLEEGFASDLPRVGLHTLHVDGRSHGFETLAIENVPVHPLEVTPDPLAPHLESEHDLLILVDSEEEEAHWRRALENHTSFSRRRAVTSIERASLGRGFVWDALGLRVLHHQELLPVRRPRRSRSRRGRDLQTAPIESFLQLTEGDHVVHAVHGVGRYLRSEILEKDGGVEEYLLIQYANDALLYLQTSRIDLIQRYVGAGGIAPRLDRLGGKSFKERKLKVLGAVRDLAADLIRVQALREAREGLSFPRDEELESLFLAEFPYEDTPDQHLAWEAIRVDMERDRPMDRLICGDVGYGKTEIAVRAAFKAAIAGYQTAVLVPTTVLAQQHYDTFRERCDGFPIEIALLSRFRSRREQKEALERAREGRVDVLIGTHRLLSKDVSFARLGLVIIDEEQRFGVQHKERFKEMRATVDLLTLSATPIPRTLHLSLVGAKDISSLTTPPAGRQEIETRLAFDDDDDLIRDALRREIYRGGQAFFLHNRVQTIDAIAQRLRGLVPEARILVGHGQMHADDLEEVMTRFAAGEADVLLATTIIESGLDIPRANTIFIDRADRFGLAELHQLRGRVGRWKHKAYCTLLLPSRLPLKAEARARLEAIEQYHSLGAGFQIAMRDLEIRGAGNILGAEQSGHISAVGYDLYCRLLHQAVDQMKAETRARDEAALPSAGPAKRKAEVQLPEEARRRKDLALVTEDRGAYVELGLQAFLPLEYVEDRDVRMKLHRRLSEVADLESRSRAREELRDRFGKIPEPAERLLDAFLLKNALGRLEVQKLRFAGDHYQIEFRNVKPIEAELLPWFPDIRVTAPGKALMMLPSFARGEPAKACRYLLRVFDPAQSPPVSPARARAERTTANSPPTPSSSPRPRPTRPGRRPPGTRS